MNSTPEKTRKERTLRSAREKCQAVLALWTGRRRPSEICRELQIPSNWQETVARSDLLGTEAIFDGEGMLAPLPELGMQYSGEFAPSYRHLRHLHVRDGVPVCFSDVYLAEDLVKKHKAAFKKSAAASVLARIPGLMISQARQKISINGAGFESARALNL